MSGIDENLFTMLAGAGSQDRGALADAKNAAGALSSLFGGYRAQKEYNEKQKMEDFLNQAVPRKPLNRIFGADSGPMTYGQLKDLSTGGVASLLKDPNNSADIRTLAVLGSGGDPVKASKLMQMLGAGGDGSGNITLTPGMAGVIHALKPEKVKGSSSEPELRALALNLQQQLKGDLSEGDRQTAMENLQMVNSRLGELGGVTLKKPKPKVTKPAAAPAPAAAGVKPEEKSAIKQLLDFLSK